MTKKEAITKAQKIIKENENPSWGDLPLMSSHEEMVAVIAVLLELVEKKQRRKK